ncbi:hypothetical protein RCL1_001619 [Eukaryota sp. TZLM3-RCL]
MYKIFIWPFLKGHPYCPAPLPPITSGTQFFENEVTGERFLEYDAYAASMKSYQSVVWSNCLGGTNFHTFSEALRTVKNKFSVPYTVYQYIANFIDNRVGNMDVIINELYQSLENNLFSFEEVNVSLPNATRTLPGVLLSSSNKHCRVVIPSPPNFVISVHGPAKEDGSVELSVDMKNVSRKREISKVWLKNLLKTIGKKGKGSVWSILPETMSSLRLSSSPVNLTPIATSSKVTEEKRQSKITDFVSRTPVKMSRSFPIDDDDIKDHSITIDGVPPPEVEEFPITKNSTEIFGIEPLYFGKILEISEFLASFSELLQLSHIPFEYLVSIFKFNISQINDLNLVTIINEVFISLISFLFGRKHRLSPGNFLTVLETHLSVMGKEEADDVIEGFKNVLETTRLDVLRSMSESQNASIVTEEIIVEIKEEEEDDDEEVVEEVVLQDESDVEEETTEGTEEEGEQEEDEDEESSVVDSEEVEENMDGEDESQEDSEPVTSSSESEEEPLIPVRRSARLRQKPEISVPTKIKPSRKSPPKPIPRVTTRSQSKRKASVVRAPPVKKTRVEEVVEEDVVEQEESMEFTEKPIKFDGAVTYLPSEQLFNLTIFSKFIS